MVKPRRWNLVLLLLTLSVASSTRAQFPSTPYLQVILDKQYYYPGDVGTLKIDIENTLSINIQVYNITVTFPWRAYINGRWDGNQTIQVNRLVAHGEWLPTVSVGFTLPSDSRYINYPYYFPGSGSVNVWASGVGSGGSAGTLSQSFSVGNAYYAGTYLDWHYIFLILIVMTTLVGVMTGAVLYYVYTGGRQRRVLRWGSQ